MANGEDEEELGGTDFSGEHPDEDDVEAQPHPTPQREDN